jgi:uncharacterized protein (TIRG00374 family)
MPRSVRHLGLKRALAYIFALACLIWVFHDIKGRELLAAMSIAKWRFAALAIIVDILTYILQGVRWKLLLAPLGRISSLRATQAVYAGLFTNELVPLRFGELVRAFLVARWLATRFTRVLPSMVVERFLDTFWLAGAVVLAAMFVPLPKEFLDAGYVLGGIVLVGASLFLWLLFRKTKGFEDSGSRLPRGVSRLASQLARGFREIGASHRIALAGLLSAGMLLCQVLAFWFLLLGCRIHLRLWAGTVALLMIRLGTAIPNAPANIGSSQFFCVLALRFFGVGKTVAAGFSITYFLVITIPLWIIGLLAIGNAGVSVSTIRSEAGAFRHDSD